MKSIFIVFLSIFSITSSFANSEVINSTEIENIEINSELDDEPALTEFPMETLIPPMATCTVNIDIELDNGTTIVGEITIEGISRIKCLALRIGVWWHS